MCIRTTDGSVQASQLSNEQDSLPDGVIIVKEADPEGMMTSLIRTPSQLKCHSLECINMEAPQYVLLWTRAIGMAGMAYEIVFSTHDEQQAQKKRKMWLDMRMEKAKLRAKVCIIILLYMYE